MKNKLIQRSLSQGKDTFDWREVCQLGMFDQADLVQMSADEDHVGGHLPSYLLACQARDTAGDSGLCCCCVHCRCTCDVSVPPERQQSSVVGGPVFVRGGKLTSYAAHDTGF